MIDKMKKMYEKKKPFFLWLLIAVPILLGLSLLAPENFLRRGTIYIAIVLVLVLAYLLKRRRGA